jgi:hypothetical protein
MHEKVHNAVFFFPDLLAVVHEMLRWIWRNTAL